MGNFQIKCCHNCPKRQVGCHSICKIYKEQKRKLEEEKKKQKEFLEKEREKEFPSNYSKQRKYYNKYLKSKK